MRLSYPAVFSKRRMITGTAHVANPVIKTVGNFPACQCQG
jgi:hypothetical protein